MTTVDQLAGMLRVQLDLADPQATRDAVATVVGSIADDPDLWDPASATLTPAGVVAVTAVMSQPDHGSAESRLLEDIAEAAAAIEAAQRSVAEHTERRDELVRVAMGTALPREEIAAAAGVRPARLYQIRDGHR